jgi:hypothetical protein
MVEKCAKGCDFQKGLMKQHRNILKHGCSFGVIISATLQQASGGDRRIQVI